MGERSPWGRYVSLQPESCFGRIVGGGGAAASGEIARYDSAQSIGAAGCTTAESRLPGISDALRRIAENRRWNPGQAGEWAAEDGLTAPLDEPFSFAEPEASRPDSLRFFRCGPRASRAGPRRSLSRTGHLRSGTH